MAATKARAPARGGGSLLELDPELGRLLDEARLETARREIRVRVTSLTVGEWNAGGLAAADPRHFGLLVLDGVLAHHVTLEDTVSTELLGAGDIVRPWTTDDAPSLLPAKTRWNALSPVRLALIDARAAAALGRYPEISAVIFDRLALHAHRLAITQCISQMTRVDRRLLALFWHLAGRWGRVAPTGIAVPLALSHRLIGELIGARRPTVSTALTELGRTGQIVRRPDGTWILTGEPGEASATPAAEVIRQRRRFMPASVPEFSEPKLAVSLEDSVAAARARRRDGIAA